MTIKNYTAHAITLYRPNGTKETINPSGLARCIEAETLDQYVNGIAIYKKEYGPVYGLPDPMDDVVYIVSYIVLKALNNSRPDVYSVTNTVRDDAGRIVGFKSFCRL